MSRSKRTLLRMLAGWLVLVVLPSWGEAGPCSPPAAAESSVSCCNRLAAADAPVDHAAEGSMDDRSCVVSCLVVVVPSTNPSPGLETAGSRLPAPSFHGSGRTDPPEPHPPEAA